ncbi:uncharacterized protein HHUB_4265 (plasmid) [Halobacterium hubeiense]|uniref:Uncharacterized protein n=1 Tax=Halobacterium hubeiense TaxID=1407499 RepID=A0A0U5D1U8_9EURY|nr:hypothetical protein [Halobacterium hubeiense]CQH64062.1 uncharacterized protein HHUB_4265 [Halobacterium hubeiense]
MDKTPPTRRDVLSVLGVGLTAGLAGCNRLTDTGSSPDRSAQTGTSSGDADITVSILTESQPAQLPPLWDDHRIEDFQAAFTVETSGAPSQVTVSTGSVEINRESGQWDSDSVTVQPGQMAAGEQEFTANARKNETTVADTATARKPVPGNYKLDVVPERNEALRQTIQTNSDEANYLDDRGGFTEDDPVFSSYSSHEHVGFDKLGVDLVALEWRHDNDYEELSPDPKTDPNIETTQFIQSIGTDTGDPEIQAIKNGEKGVTTYPNGEWNSQTRDGGSFDYETFANAETVGEALDGLHTYLFNWQAIKTDIGPRSDEDFIYAPTLEQAIEQKNNNNLEAHGWDFDLDSHGNGLIYGKNPDGSDELRVMETVANPVTSTPQTIHEQRHPLVEDSNYLNPDHEEFNKYWHPLRFGWDGYSNSQRWNFEEEKRKASVTVRNIASSLHPEDAAGIAARDQNSLGMTTEYLQDFTEKLRTYNQNDADFQELYNQSKILDKLFRDEENNHVIYGGTENPQYAVVEDSSVIEEVWKDEQGRYDDFDQFLRDNPSHSTALDDGNPTLDRDAK